mmetsp:Transcript_17655/g.40518  ORF Transcript_17655/g.40518 Transcript_17655/m.40518 type:complete len:300 (+) Transcript_17655:847-1746(+)
MAARRFFSFSITMKVSWITKLNTTAMYSQSGPYCSMTSRSWRAPAGWGKSEKLVLTSAAWLPDAWRRIAWSTGRWNAAWNSSLGFVHSRTHDVADPRHVVLDRVGHGAGRGLRVEEDGHGRRVHVVEDPLVHRVSVLHELVPEPLALAREARVGGHLLRDGRRVLPERVHAVGGGEEREAPRLPGVRGAPLGQLDARHGGLAQLLVVGDEVRVGLLAELHEAKHAEDNDPDNKELHQQRVGRPALDQHILLRQEGCLGIHIPKKKSLRGRSCEGRLGVASVRSLSLRGATSNPFIRADR